MKYTLSEILTKIEEDIVYHHNQLKLNREDSPDWNFHLGWVDALTSYRYKLQNILGNSK